MLNFSSLKITNKLRVLSIISIISVVVLGFVSNYSFNTSKLLGIIINAERIQNNTFQDGVEDFYKYQVSGNKQFLDSALVKIENANQMAYHFGIIDQLLNLSKKEYIDILYDQYKVAFNYDRTNAYLMANRVKLFLILKPVKLFEAQQIAMKGYLLGEKIKNKTLAQKSDSLNITGNTVNADLIQMRNFYGDFALAISSLNTFANTLLFVSILLIVILLILTIAIISTIISRSIVSPVQEMVQKFGIIAKGNLKMELSIHTSNEIGNLASSFREIQTGLREVVEYTRNVAAGDYSTQITPRSAEDELSIGLNKMVVKLKESYDKSEQESWFTSGINRINEELRGNQKLEDISAHALSFMMEFLHSQMGSVLLYQEEYQYLKLMSFSGFDQKKLKERIKLNEGIIGQAASEKRMIILSDVPDQSFVTYSSSGEFIPRQIVIVPLLFNEALIGILELASIQIFTEIEIQFIKQASEIIAINLNSAENIHKTNILLQKTQDQASELQVQQEELRVANEELVEHTKVLTENEKRLQVQQEELRVANEELEERTRQLEVQKDDISSNNTELTATRDKLEIKAKELQLASQYKSEFLANMSHELRTPLNSLLILSNLLAKNKKGNLTDDQIQSAKIIHKSGTDLLQLINEVLDLSKIEAGKISIEINTVKTLEIREEILMNFKASAEDKNLSFEVRVTNDFPQQISTDSHRLMQILKNLLSNAFKFTSSGSISVDFMSTPQGVKLKTSGLNSDNTCCIRVSDTGVGIPAEKLEAIFEAFQQADGSISRKFGGTGLGLSISKELIRMLGGEIQLESKVNTGSSFFIYLPTPIISKSVLPDDLPVQSNALADQTSVQKPTDETKQYAAEAPFINDDRDKSMNERTVLIIHPSRQQAEKFLQQARSKNYRAIVAPTIQDGIILAEKYHAGAIMLAAEFANVKNPNYQKLRTHSLIGKLPVHLITPVNFEGTVEHAGLQTLETIGFSDALTMVDRHFISHSKRILVIEDNAITLKIIRHLLSKLDIQLEEANLAEQAFGILTREKFDCIILDLGLPDYSGKALLEKMKENNIAIPKVIVHTGKDMSNEEIKDLKIYTDTIILKGIKSDERLMDEVTLFLHQVSKTIPGVKMKTSTADEDVLFKGKKILVVDDEIRNVFALGKLLEERDIEVLQAENGQIAIDLLIENKQIDLVLMDVMMPVMNGYEAMRIIRNTPEIKNIPIICLTAKAMKEDYENALKNGANDYLSKPLREDKLFAMLKIWLYRK
ncbi:MAG TPA: response regulator [Prolixibacteraceae bacterium]|nr:response regulator [Prolixibacteraceae bacterium]